jgi:Mce-associated membrane protein
MIDDDRAAVPTAAPADEAPVRGRRAGTGVIAPLASAMPAPTRRSAANRLTEPAPLAGPEATGSSATDPGVAAEPGGDGPGAGQPDGETDPAAATAEASVAPATGPGRVAGATSADAERDSALPAAARGRRRRWWWALGAVAAFMVAVVVWGALQLSSDDSLAAARTSALAAARFDANALVTYQYQHLDHDWAVVKAHATPTFWRSFSQSSAGLAAALRQYHAASTGQVLAVGLASATTDRAVVLAFVDQRVTSTASKTPTVDESRVELTLVRQSGRWLIQRVELVG